MTDYLEFKIDKFTFKTATDRYYSDEGLWVKPENGGVRIGISDFLQQRSGDMAFVEVKPPGTVIADGEELVVVETIKVNISLGSPLSGKVLEANPAMESSPEVINQDPYGAGWIAILEAADLHADRQKWLDPDKYFAKVKQESEREVNRE